MTEGDVVADFTAKVLADDAEHMKPVKCRVLLNHEQLVVVTGAGKKIVLLSNITDTNPGDVSEGLSNFFEDSLAVAYTRNGEQNRVVIGGDEDVIVKFRALLFRLLVGKQTVLAVHPAKRGGRVTGASARKMVLEIIESGITLTRNGETTKILVESVIGFEHKRKEARGESRPTLVVDYSAGSTTKTTHISLLSKRKLTFLSQFVRLSYDSVVQGIRELEVSEVETQCLVSLYSAGGDAPLSMIIDDGGVGDQDVVGELLDKELVMRDDDRLYLTSRGEIVVTEEIEAVNQ